MIPQVLIVGAGPVGLTMAAELARYGVSVRIVDKAAQRTDKSKALVVWSRTLELLDRAGCAGAFVEAGKRVDGANIIAGGKLLAHISFADVRSPYSYALMLPQSETERLLEAHLSRLGVQVERQVELTQFEATSDGVRATLRTGPEKERLEVPWLIGCDGAHSTVRQGLGMQFDGDTLQSDWMLADLHLSGFPFPDSEIVTYWHEKGVLAVFPITNGRYRVVADQGLSEREHPSDPTLDEIQSVLEVRGPGGVVASDPVWLSGFRINERKVADYRAGRVFLAGDAAHIHSPAGGQGMNTGMQDAFNLAWKLALVCHGVGSARGLLESYSIERSAIGEQVLADAGRMTALATLRNQAAQVVRNLVGRVVLGLAPARDALVNKMTEVAIEYENSPLNGPRTHGADGPSPGMRILPLNGQPPFGAGNSPRFALMAAPEQAARDLLDEFGDLLEPALRPPLQKDYVWLVRPDGYVACVVEASGLRRIADYLMALRTPA